MNSRFSNLQGANVALVHLSNGASLDISSSGHTSTPVTANDDVIAVDDFDYQAYCSEEDLSIYDLTED